MVKFFRKSGKWPRNSGSGQREYSFAAELGLSTRDRMRDESGSWMDSRHAMAWVAYPGSEMYYGMHQAVFVRAQ